MSVLEFLETLDILEVLDTLEILEFLVNPIIIFSLLNFAFLNLPAFVEELFLGCEAGHVFS